MPTLIETLLPTKKVDYVFVTDQNFNQVFPNAKVMKVTVKEEAKLMEHPVETGIIIVDHRIILPVEIELSIFIENAYYLDTYKIMRGLYLNGTLLSVQTRTGVYDNQIIESMPHEEDPDYYDAITIALKLKQVQFTTAKYGVVPKRAQHTTTQDRGTIQPAPVNQSGLAELTDTALGVKK